MVSGLLLARRALDPPQRQLRQNQRDTPPPLRRQRLPNGLGRGAAHDAIQASARLRKAPCSPESVTRRILSTYKRHLLWDIERFLNRLKNSRRVATRYEKLIETFSGFVLLAAIRIWIRFVHAT
jgi:Transposase DDE domain